MGQMNCWITQVPPRPTEQGCLSAPVPHLTLSHFLCLSSRHLQDTPDSLHVENTYFRARTHVQYHNHEQMKVRRVTVNLAQNSAKLMLFCVQGQLGTSCLPRIQVMEDLPLQ